MKNLNKKLTKIPRCEHVHWVRAEGLIDVEGGSLEETKAIVDSLGDWQKNAIFSQQQKEQSIIPVLGFGLTTKSSYILQQTLCHLISRTHKFAEKCTKYNYPKHL